MFDCKTYNEKLTKKIPFIKSSNKNLEIHGLGTTTISTIQYQFNDGTRIVLESVDDTDYENYVTVTFRDNVWDCANKLVEEYEMEFPESVIPYFWNIGFKNYHIVAYKKYYILLVSYKHLKEFIDSVIKKDIIENDLNLSKYLS